jgi:hypothetical protein
MDEREETSTAIADAVAAREPIAFAEFLENVSPSQMIEVKDVYVKKRSIGTSIDYYELNVPQLQLHCSSETCNGLRFFRYLDGNRVLRDANDGVSTYLTYLCANCRTRQKVYSLRVMHKTDHVGQCYKFGERPQYGPPTPARLTRLFGKDREIFLKGRQCENHGLGIGAFTYYRRVVESHKDQILGEIIRVAKKIGAPPEMVKVLEDAQKEIQFSKALVSVKNAMPQVLLVNGHNPLTLLHRALSVGVHELSDEQCLQIAHDIRVVLVELAERLGQALKDEAEINTAISRLMNPGGRSP